MSVIAVERTAPAIQKPTVAAPAALVVADIDHAYGTRRALRNVSFDVAAGEFTALLGLNGAGKSTLFALITRLFGIQSGHISVFGHDIGRAPGDALRQLGVVFQPRTLDLDLSVMQNLLYHAALQGIGRREARARSTEVLARIGLADRENSKVRALSGGQMRRVEIARALLHRPRLLLLDEATVGLDVQARADILGYVRTLVADQGVGVLWATHLLDEVAATDHLVILHHGRVLAHDAASHILSETDTPDLAAAFRRITETTDRREAAS